MNKPAHKVVVRRSRPACHLRTCALGLVATTGLLRSAAVAAEPKYYLPETPRQARVISATFLGGAGHEWLVGGGWQPDGSVILAGGLALLLGRDGYNIVKLDAEQFQTIGSTKWRAETSHGAGLMRMSSLVALANGTVCVGGTGGPYGLRQTKASLMPDGPSGGNYVAVLSADLSEAIFSTTVGGAGVINSGDGAWGAVSGPRRLLLVSGAQPANETNVLALTAEKTPTRDALQPVFGGGLVDGYAILLEVPASEPVPAKLPNFARLGIESLAAWRPEFGSFGEDGLVFEFVPTHPKFVTADIELRDAADTNVWATAPRPVWPSFAYGRSVAGQLTWRDGRLQGQATVPCAHWVQTAGEQSRRVMNGATNAVSFTLSDLGEFQERELPGRKFLRWCQGQGKLVCGTRTLSVPLQCVAKVQDKLPSGGVPGVALSAFSRSKAASLAWHRWLTATLTCASACAARSRPLDYRTGIERQCTSPGVPSPQARFADTWQ